MNMNGHRCLIVFYIFVKFRFVIFTSQITSRNRGGKTVRAWCPFQGAPDFLKYFVIYNFWNFDSKKGALAMPVSNTKETH